MCGVCVYERDIETETQGDTGGERKGVDREGGLESEREREGGKGEHVDDWRSGRITQTKGGSERDTEKGWQL